MVSARDAYDDWYEDDEPYGDAGASRSEHAASRYEDAAPRPLSLVRRADLTFEVVRPEDFEAAQRVADRLRAGASVLLDFEDCDGALAGRLTDFASGLVYALGGSLQHVGDSVLLLTPSDMTVSGDELSDIRTAGFYNRI
jgi:FtsZ-interacting cell division protein YlmF